MGRRQGPDALAGQTDHPDQRRALPRRGRRVGGRTPLLVSLTNPTNGEPGPGEGDGLEVEAGALPRAGHPATAYGADLIEQGAPRRLWERP